MSEASAVVDHHEWKGWKMADLTNFLDKAYEGKDFAELAESPVDALQGLSKADAEALEKALGIKTVHDLATNKIVPSQLSIPVFITNNDIEHWSSNTWSHAIRHVCGM